jgi:hypothetical protein
VLCVLVPTPRLQSHSILFPPSNALCHGPAPNRKLTHITQHNRWRSG